ncbi:MAG: hypothetical protein PHV17_02285 [Candidatus Omnitrophica bacterium]|nr:hypothetical protein [Candidatus Omnitrophota bacterium]
MNDLYADKKKIIKDFWLGFFNAIAIAFLVLMGYVIIGGILSRYSDFLLFFLTISILVICVIYYFKKGRRYFAIGMLASLFGPLLIFGACLSMF